MHRQARVMNDMTIDNKSYDIKYKIQNEFPIYNRTVAFMLSVEFNVELNK